MVTRKQQILVKRAQREAGLGDAEYREVLESVSGCRSTTDGRMTDHHVDLALSFMEAIYWRGVDAGTLPAPSRAAAVFRQRGYWSSKNLQGSTSRERFSQANPARQISDLERALGDLGFGESYCGAIRAKVMAGNAGTYSLHLYKAALARTLRAKQAALIKASSAGLPY